jgi:hypothetical protein
MALQDIIDTAVNVEINRSKLVAQTLSRSGRISVVSRNWANPFRFTVTPKPVWTASEYRSILEPLFTADRYETQGFYLNNISATTGLAIDGNSWMIPYQGNAAANNAITSYSASTDTTGAKIVLTNVNSTTITAGLYLVKKGDYLRPLGFYYPYIASSDVIIPTAVSGVTGTIQSAGVYLLTSGANASRSGNNAGFTSTTTRSFITGLSSFTNLSVGQIISKTAGSGAFGGVTYIENINNSTTNPNISIVSTTAMTAGSITFSGTGNTGTPAVCVPINRGFIGTVSTNTAVRVGARAALFNVIVAKLPQIRYLPGQLVELTGDIELVEQIQ